MPTIRFTKNYPALTVEPGTNLMDALLRAGMPVASSCHGDGVCAKCRVRLMSGAENLSHIGPVEQIARDRLKIQREFRLSCQAQVLGDIEVDTSYW